MSKIFIEETTLSAIGSAIREKTGKSDLIAPTNMPTEIRGIETGGGGSIEVEPVVLTGDCTSVCAGAMAGNYIKLFGDTVSTKDITKSTNMFNAYSMPTIPFDINFKTDTGDYGAAVTGMFLNSKIVTAPNIKNLHIARNGCNTMFQSCHHLKHFPEGFGSDWVVNEEEVSAYNYWPVGGCFKECAVLEELPTEAFYPIWRLSKATGTSYSPYSDAFNLCLRLRKIENMPVTAATYTSNMFNNMVYRTCMLESFTFETNEDGTPKTANWKNQTLDFAGTVGYNGQSCNRLYIVDVPYEESGFTDDLKVASAADYERLKDADWWGLNVTESRFGYPGAVALINSLPDTSAYGTNIVKFKGTMGQNTVGAINTLTEEEIAVATAKGWTVSLT